MSSFQIKKSLFPSVYGMRVYDWGGERERRCVLLSPQVVNVNVGGVQRREQTDNILGNINIVGYLNIITELTKMY